jgi:hypothetical protein
VSLVDKPANEVQFLVTKNLEDSDMAEPNVATNAALAGGAERVTVEKTAGENDVTAALQHVGAIVADIAKMAGIAMPAAAAPAAGADEAEAIEKAKKGQKYTTMADMMKAAGLEGEALTAALEKAKKAGFDPNQKFPTAQPPVTKADEGAATPALTSENVMDVVASAVSKAKQFTPDRIEKLKAAQEILKLLIDSVEQGTNPGVSTPSGTSFGASGVKDLTKPSETPTIKSADPEVVAALTNITTVLKALTDKVATIEAETASIKKARPSSESLEGEGGTETKTQKSSMWGGVL